MHAAVGVAVLLMGGWVFPGDDQGPGWTGTGPVAPLKTSDATDKNDKPPMPPWDTPPGTPGGAPLGTPLKNPSMQLQGNIPQELSMPDAPTEQPSGSAQSGGGGGGGSPFSGLPPLGQRRGTPARSTSSSGPRMLPPSPMDSGGSTPRPAGASAPANFNLPQPSFAKPFSGYRAPSNSSPYMDLYRPGSVLGGYDNYTNLVRPRLDQQNLNRQVTNDVRGLEMSTQAQGQTIQQLDQSNRGAGRTNVGDYYMNFRQYYPGYGR
jgi:hypothetical protein